MKNQNIRTVIKPEFYFSRLFGLAPYSITSKKLSTFATLYTLCLLCVLFTGISMIIINLFKNENNTKLIKFVTFVRIIAPTVTTFVCCSVILFKHKNLSEFIEDIEVIENIITQQLGRNLPYKKYTQIQIYGILIIIVVNGVQIMFSFVNDMEIIYFFSVAINMIAQNQFVMCVFLFKQYFSVLNRQLFRMGNFPRYKHISEFLTPALKIDKIPTINCVYVKPFSRSSHNILNVIIELHRLLCISCDNFNSFYSVMILLTVGSNMLNTTFNLYEVFKNFSTTYDQTLYLTLLSALYTAVWNILQDGVIAFSCASASEEVRINVSYFLYTNSI